MGRKKISSDFLKECIADALFILLRTKSIESITVREITELANVSRITYYRNFTSKENVIEFKLDKLMTEWIEKSAPKMKAFPPNELSIRFFPVLLFYSGYCTDSDPGKPFPSAFKSSDPEIQRYQYRRQQRILPSDFYFFWSVRHHSLMDGHRNEGIPGRNGTDHFP